MHTWTPLSDTLALHTVVTPLDASNAKLKQWFVGDGEEVVVVVTEGRVE